MAKGRPHSSHLRQVKDDVVIDGKTKGMPSRAEYALKGITFKAGIPKAPAFLGVDDRIAFDDYVETLRGTGILSEVDGYSIAAACMALADLLNATAELAVLPSVTVDGPNGMKRNHPAYQRKSDADKRFRAWLCEFGLTPAARGKLGNRNPDHKEPSADDEFFSDAA